MSRLRVPAEVVEEVRVRALRRLETQPRGQQHYSAYASVTGFSISTLKSFFAQEPGRASPHVAQALVDCLPELGDGLVCASCGRLQGASGDEPAGFVFTR